MHADSTGSHLRPIATLAVALIAALLIISGLQRWFAAIGDWPALGEASQDALFTLILFGALLAVAMLGLGLDGRLRGLAGGAALVMAAGGLALGMAGLLTEAGIAALAGMVHRGAGAWSALGAVIGTIAILFQSGVEEVYFRGWLQPVLVRRWGAAAGLIVASIAFAGLHIAGGARAPLALVNLTLGGALFGLLALRSAGLVAPVAAHFAWNWGEQILLGMDPNPGIGSFGAIVDLDLVGSPLWGGSDEGLNASIAMTATLTALVILVAGWRGRRGDAIAMPAGAASSPAARG